MLRTRVECPRCAAQLPVDVSECPECGAEIGLAARTADAVLPELRALRRWLGVLVLGLAVLALVIWDHYASPLWAIPGRPAAMMAAPYLAASGLLGIAFLLAPRFPLAASLATLILYLASAGSTHVLDPNSGMALEPTLWARAVFLLIVLRAVYAGYMARRMRQELAAHLATATARP